MERAQEESTTYAMWILEKQFMLVTATAYVANPAGDSFDSKEKREAKCGRE